MLFIGGCARGPAIVDGDERSIQTLLYDTDQIAAARDEIERGEPAHTDGAEELRRAAEAALEEGPYSVTFKTGMPPSNDRHDYMSIGVYWWPDSTKDDGHPYVRRDGDYNPEALDDTFDKNAFMALANDAPTLALAGYLLQDRRYSDHAARLMRTWFVDPDTRMNPHLAYGQAIPGRNDGRPIGIIETTRLVPLGEAARLLEGSGSWSDEDHRALEAWYADYLQWLMESDFGQTEADHYNNHGTWFDVQAAYLARFVERDDVARSILERVPERRIFQHIAADGSQPHEIARTRSFDYSAMNLQGLMQLAVLAEPFGIDLWNATDAEGRSIRAAVDFLYPYVDDVPAWPHEQITDVDSLVVQEMFLRAAAAYGDPGYAEAAAAIAPGTVLNFLIAR